MAFLNETNEYRATCNLIRKYLNMMFGLQIGIVVYIATPILWWGLFWHFYNDSMSNSFNSLLYIFKIPWLFQI